jgi:hypothetical protein
MSTRTANLVARIVTGHAALGGSIRFVIRPIEGGRRDMPPHRDARVAMMSIRSTVGCQFPE